MSRSARDRALVRAGNSTTEGDEDTPYYIISAESPSSEPNILRLPDGTPLNSFVSALENEQFGVISKLTANNPTPFLSTDPWFLWFGGAISATSLKVQTDANVNISGFKVEIDWPNSTDASARKIKFDTDFVIPAFGVPIGDNPPLGILGDTGIMAFGLDNTQNLTLKSTLADVLTYAGLENLVSSPLVVALGTQIGLTLASSISSSDGARNAVWFEPGSDFKTTIRLQWSIDDLPQVQSFLSFLKGVFSIKSANLITRRISTTSTKGGDATAVTKGQAMLAVEFVIGESTFLGALTFGADFVHIELTTNQNVFADIVKWLVESVGDVPFADWLNAAGAAIFNVIMLRKIEMTVQMVSGKTEVVDFGVSMEIAMKVGGRGDNPARILMYYGGAPGFANTKLRGQLWFVPGPSPVIPPSLFSDWEQVTEFLPISAGQSSSLDLAKLQPSGEITNVPEGIPHEITDAWVEVDSQSIAFFGSITCDLPKNSSVPKISLGLVSLYGKYSFGGDEATKGKFELALDINVDIVPPASSKFQSPTTLIGSLEYNNGEWDLFAGMTPIYASTLYQFFDPDAQDGVMNLLEALEINTLVLRYTYQKMVASKFSFTGIVMLGDLELDLKYTYSTDGWEFSATLGATAANTNLGALIESITGDTDLLPSFVADIPIAATGTGGALSVKCNKAKKSGGTGQSKPEDFILFFSATVQIEPVKATFVQYREVGWARTVPSKRVFKISLTKLPSINVPLVGDLTQPFDEMFYMWVQDNALQPSTKKLPGLAESEVTYINQGLLLKGGGAIDELIFKETKKANAKKPDDVVIAAGSHFVLVLKDKDTRKVVLDYVFGGDKPPAKNTEKLEVRTDEDGVEDFRTLDTQALTAKSGTGTGGKGDSAMAPYKKTVGPISISNIGIKYKGDTLSVLLDAAFLLGPIGFTLIGFSIDINLKGKTLQNFPLPDFSLSGLAVSFDKPPLTIAGLYTHVDDGKINYYAGGIIVGFTPYLFQAAGFYGKVKDPEFTSVFVFGKLEGPLVTLEFAEISGITGGFGYNSDVAFPSVDKVTEFPFVAGTGVGKDVMTTLINLVQPGGWFSPRNGSFWVAAGLKVTAFETLSIDAVLVVEWNPYVKLGIFGVAVVDIPRGASVTFAHVELGISATVDFAAGVMKFEAQLSPNSYIFDPSCHLTGGFALYYWFSPADPTQGNPELEGDWVFTIGGFHRAFLRPKHYPNPPRLAITWSVNNNISITGEAYFAITPKCCMGGGRLHASLSLGPLSAWFDAYADFLINYKPFHFMADGGISVGVSCKVDLLITSFTIKIEIGAQLHLEGPPLCGRVHVDFWVMSFNIDFGPSPQEAKAVSLKDFYKLVLQAGEGTKFSSDTFMIEEAKSEATVDDDKAHVFGCRGGLLEGKGDQTTAEGATWQVRAGTFSFGVTCRFATGKATVMPASEFSAATEGDKELTTKPITCDTPIYAKPMHLTTGLTSELEVTIKRDKSSSAFSAKEHSEDKEHQWQLKPIMKSVPSALWGYYNRDQDPQQKGNNVPALLNGTGVAINLLMGIEIVAPKPTLSPDLIPKFNAVDAMSLSVNDRGKEPLFPKYGDASKNWSPAAVADPDKQWGLVHDLWVHPENDDPESRQKTLDLWKSTMFWDKELTGDLPTLLLEKFENLYLAAPMVSVA